MGMQDAQEKYQKFRDEILAPLVKQRRHHDVCDLIIEKLDIEIDPEFRFELIPDLCVHLVMLGENDACLQWARTLAEEFDDRPHAWTNMAIFGVGSNHRNPLNDEEQARKLECYKNALDRAYKKNESVRYVLFDICRLLTSMKDYEQHEAYMREIMEDLENAREIDIPFLEDDWLKRVPEGSMDEDLRRTYQALVTADKARRRAAATEEGPPTRAELEKFL